MAVIALSPGSPSGTSSRGGDGGGKPPRKPTGGKGPRGHYSAAQIKDLRK
jgi:hypothetical protein